MQESQSWQICGARSQLFVSWRHFQRARTDLKKNKKTEDCVTLRCSHLLSEVKKYLMHAEVRWLQQPGLRERVRSHRSSCGRIQASGDGRHSRKHASLINVRERFARFPPASSPSGVFLAFDGARLTAGDKTPPSPPPPPPPRLN